MFTRLLFSTFVILSLSWGSTLAADDLSTSRNWVYFADTVMGGKSTGHGGTRERRRSRRNKAFGDCHD